MDIRKTIATAIVTAMVLSMTACANNENPSGEDKTQSENSATNSSGNYPDKPFGLGDEIPDPPKQVSMWDVLPEIPVTDASAFTYKYDSELGGMVVTDYLRESPKVRIPDKLEGEPVVKVDFSGVKKEITQLVMPDGVKEISLPYNGKIRSALQYVNIPDSVTEIDYYSTFENCENIQAAYYKGKTYNQEHIEWLLDAVNLGETGMKIYNGRLEDVSRELTEVVIPDGVTSICNYAFKGCTSLTSVTIPSSVNYIGDGAFEGCVSLTSVTIDVTKIGGCAFSGCTSLTSVNISDRVTEIDRFVFSGCTSLTSITIPDSVTKIGVCAFSDCTSLTSVNISDSVTVIGDYAFDGCTSLTSVTIPNSVTKIGRDAFEKCPSLASATYKGKTYNYAHIYDLYKAINGG